MSEDIFDVGSIRGEIEAMVAGSFRKKISNEDIDKLLEAINDRYKDDEAYKVYSHISLFLCRFLTRIENKKREIKDGKKEVVKKEKKSPELHKKPKKPLRRRRRNFLGS